MSSHPKQYVSYKNLGPQKKETSTYEVMEIQNDQHKNQILNDYSIVCVCLTAHWCNPCQILSPMYSKLSEKYTVSGRCILAKSNAELKLCSEFDVNAIPAFVFYKNGQPVRKDGKNFSIIGGDLEQVKTVLEQLLGTSKEKQGLIQGGSNIRQNTVSAYNGQNNFANQP